MISFFQNEELRVKKTRNFVFKTMNFAALHAVVRNDEFVLKTMNFVF